MKEQDKKPAAAGRKRKMNSPTSSDNTKSHSSASSLQPIKEEPTDFCPPEASSMKVATCMYNKTASGGLPETGPPSGTHCGANAAAGESAGMVQSGEVPLPTADSPFQPEPLTSPSEQLTSNQQQAQLPFLSSSPELASCPVKEEQCSDANDPLSDDEYDKLPPVTEFWSDSEEVYTDPSFGGVAIAPIHGSVMIECARRELHATTALKEPNRINPLRVSLVFYQHKNLHRPKHGFDYNRMKFECKDIRKKKLLLQEYLLSPEANLLYKVPSRIAPTLTRDNIVTVSPYALTHVAGPYNHWV
ncbi:methylcytosine dioxygenase TET1 isoform X1 [Sigmodon hispidus]